MAKFSIEDSRVDIGAAWERKLELPKCVLPGLFHGLVGGLYADSDVGKTWIALQTAVQVAADDTVNLLNMESSHNGKVLYISGEDPMAQLHNRTNAILSALRGRKDSARLRKQIETNLVLVSKMADDLNIMDVEFFNDLVAAGKGCELIILDTLRKFHHEDENKNSAMIPVMRQINLLAQATGAAVIYAHHVTKAAQRDGATDQTNSHSGAGAIRTEAKYGANLSIMTESEGRGLTEIRGGATINKSQLTDFVKFTTTKGNYGKKPAPSWFKRADDGRLVPVTFFASLNPNKRGRGQDSALPATPQESLPNKVVGTIGVKPTRRKSDD